MGGGMIGRHGGSGVNGPQKTNFKTPLNYTQTKQLDNVLDNMRPAQNATKRFKGNDGAMMIPASIKGKGYGNAVNMQRTSTLNQSNSQLNSSSSTLNQTKTSMAHSLMQPQRN